MRRAIRREIERKDKKKRAVIYARFSSNNQDIASIDKQIRICKEYAALNDIEIVKIYKDEAESARFIENRADFKKMIKDAEKGLFNTVLLWRFDRFSRDEYDDVIYKKKLKDLGIKVVSSTEPIPEGASGEMFEKIIVATNAWYSRQLSESVISGFWNKAQDARHLVGKTPLGYDRGKNGEYLINKDEAKIVAKMYSLYLEGYSTWSIADYLNSIKHKTKRGNRWSSGSVRHILKNEKYKGTYVFSLEALNEQIIIEDGVPNIVSKEDWNLTNKLMKQRRMKPKNGKKENRHYYALSGKIKCSHCNSNYAGVRKTGKTNGKQYDYYYYICNAKHNYRSDCKSKNVKADQLETLVFECIKNNLLKEERLNELTAAVFDAYNQTSEEVPTETREDILKEIKRRERKIDEIFDDIDKGELNKRAGNRKINEIEEEIEELEKKLEECLYDDFDSISIEEIKEFLKEFQSDLDDTELKRSLVDTFVKEIIVYDDRVEVFFKVDPLNRIDFEEQNLVNYEKLSCLYYTEMTKAPLKELNKTPYTFRK